MPRVSVIIPTHNCARYLDRSITSVLKQSYKDFELIIVDDGSTDDTEAVINRYSGDPRVRYIKKPKREGLPAARNAGIENAKANLIAFLDADDLFLKDKLLKQVEFFEKNGPCNVSYTNEVYFKEGEDREIISPRCHLSGDIFYYLKRSNFIHVSTVMAGREVLKQNRFDESLASHEDWELFLRMAFKGINFLYIKEPLSKVRVRQSSMTVNKNTMDATRIEVGLRARAYWSNIKKSSRLRYIKAKAKAFLIGFPGRACFNRPVPQELL